MALGGEVVDPLGDGSHELGLDVARGGRHRDFRQGLALHLLPALSEVPRHVGHDRPPELRRRVVPRVAVADPVDRGVVAIAVQGGEVDAADEGHLVVDDHELLVVAVHRALLRVQCAADPSSAQELGARGPDVAAVRLEDRDGRALPQQDAHVSSLRDAGEQVAQARGLLAAIQAEVRGDVPSGDVDMRPRGRDRRVHARQRRGAVDEHLDRAAGARLEVAPRPQPPVVGWVDRRALPDTPQPPRVVRVLDALDDVTQPAVDRVQDLERAHRLRVREPSCAYPQPVMPPSSGITAPVR
jgi:hypothetical protein